MNHIAFIVAIQPDSQQASALGRVLNERPDLEVVVVASKDAALAVVDERIPDVVLVHPFFDPDDDDHLSGYLRSHPSAAHVQVLTIPTLKTAGDAATASRDSLSTPGLFDRRRYKPALVTPAECEPRIFASDVADYATRALELKRTVNERSGFEISRQSDRRRARRWSPNDLPWIASVQMPGGEPAALVDLSAGGALVRTGQRPDRALFRGGVPLDDDRRALTLRLTSGEAVPITGQLIRCCVAARHNMVGLYEVAFRFDSSADAFVPAAANDRDDVHEASASLMLRPDRAVHLRR